MKIIEKRKKNRAYFAKKFLLEIVENEQFFSSELSNLEVKIFSLASSESLFFLSFHLSQIILLALQSRVALSFRCDLVLRQFLLPSLFVSLKKRPNKDKFKLGENKI